MLNYARILLFMNSNQSSKCVHSSALLQECLEALNVQLLPEQESDNLSALFSQTVPMTKWGKVDWDKIHSKIVVGYDPNQIMPALERLLKQSVDKTVFVEWSTYDIPVIKADLDMIIRFFDDVISVSLEKFIFNLMQGYIIEVRFSGEITVGLVTPVEMRKNDEV